MKKRMKIILPALLVLALIIYGAYWAFYDIQRLDGQDLLNEVPSPNGAYTLSVYRNNGGATTGYAVLCSVTDNETGRDRNIYWKYRCEEADVRWTDEDTAVINGIELDVWKDSYDYRHD